MAIVLPFPPAGGYKLSDYEFLLQRLLHDPQGRMYPLSDLIRYINLGRDRVARDTLCLRTLQTGLTISQNVEKYNVYTFLPFGPVTVGVLGVSIYWGNLKYQLGQIPWQRFDAWLRTWNTFRQRPTHFANYGGNIVYVGPVPDQNYVSDWDTALTSVDLDDDTSTEQIPIPFQNPVVFYAAYLAKQYEQSIGEADRFMQEYQKQRANAQATWRRRMVMTPYEYP